MPPTGFLRGFTLIELLIVVAIIAILAAIAVPNFMEAQTRAKVSRVRNDERTLTVGLEAYYMEYNSYPMTDLGDFVTPPAAWYQSVRAWVALTTPTQFLTHGKLLDPFRPSEVRADPCGYLQIGTALYSDPSIGGYTAGFPRNVYALVSAGPDFKDDTNLSGYPFSYGTPYDATNGTRSPGDVFRCGPSGKTPRGWVAGVPKGGNLGDRVDPPY